MFLELVPNKVKLKIYNRQFKNSTHYYNTNNNVCLTEVQNNHQEIIKDLGGERLNIAKQIHSTEVIYLEQLWAIDEEPEGDAIVTTLPKTIIGIKTADCVPVLLTTKSGEVIAGAHCGWRSAFGGILSKVLDQMNSLDNSEVIAVIGPSIQQESYEIDENFYQNFIQQSKDNKQFFINSDRVGHYLFDLPGYIKNQLQNLNIKLFHHFKEDTYLNPALYPSHRYATHYGKGEKYKGHILSTIIKEGAAY